METVEIVIDLVETALISFMKDIEQGELEDLGRNTPLLETSVFDSLTMARMLIFIELTTGPIVLFESSAGAMIVLRDAPEVREAVEDFRDTMFGILGKNASVFSIIDNDAPASAIESARIGAYDLLSRKKDSREERVSAAL